MGNMIDILSGRAFKNQENNWIEVKKASNDVYDIIDNNMTVKNGDWITDAVALGYMDWDNEVEDLDNGSSDGSQCFGISSQLKWKDVIFSDYVIRAPSIKRIKEALEHISIGAWCPGDV